jgi:hypothetical protein
MSVRGEKVKKLTPYLPSEKIRDGKRTSENFYPFPGLSVRIWSNFDCIFSWIIKFF